MLLLPMSHTKPLNINKHLQQQPLNVFCPGKPQQLRCTKYVRKTRCKRSHGTPLTNSDAGSMEATQGQPRRTTSSKPRKRVQTWAGMLRASEANRCIQWQFNWVPSHLGCQCLHYHHPHFGCCSYSNPAARPRDLVNNHNMKNNNHATELQ